MTRILDLSTTQFDRPIVRIDGVDYEMRSVDEISVPLIKRLQKLGADAEGGADLELVDGWMNEAMDIIMVSLPTNVRDRLSLTHKRRIIESFTREVGEKMNTPAASPASSASTAAE
jgi:hypothetical protein